MNSEHYFLEIDKSIKSVASKADLIMFDGIISKKDKNELFEDCIILACFYMANFRGRPPFLLDFIEKNNTKEKLTKEERRRLGAFFTPPYIAEYICKKTIAPLIDKIEKDKRIKDKIKKIYNLKICDPAMGGGIFLVCAHNYIMDRIMMIEQRKKYTIEEMAKMSSNSLYGVDINPKAVEFSKMILNLNIAKWSCINKLDEYVNIAEKNSR